MSNELEEMKKEVESILCISRKNLENKIFKENFKNMLIEISKKILHKNSSSQQFEGMECLFRKLKNYA